MKKNTKLIKKIVREYISFTRKTSGLINEAKRATVLSLKKMLNLNEGDIILINEDGSLEIETKNNDKENNMLKITNGEKENLTLNGRDVSEDELQRQREAVENQKGARLEEVSKNNFRLRLKD
jgi:hypothetical protein